MASRDGVTTKRFVFGDCLKKPLTYLAIARAAGFGKEAIRGRLVVNVELYEKRQRGGARRPSKRSRSRRTRGR